MKPWLIIIGILLLLIGVVVGLLQSATGQILMGNCYLYIGDKYTACDWYLEVGLGGNKMAQDKFIDNMPLDYVAKNEADNYHILYWENKIYDNVIVSRLKNKSLSGDTVCMSGYGLCLYFGIELKEDKSEGCAWIRVASEIYEYEKGRLLFKNYIRYLEPHMTPQEIAQSKVLAEEIVGMVRAKQGKGAVGQ